jgi:hypothetical protein
MKALTTLFALATLCATGYGQTIKSLGYNTTNGQILYSGTNPLTFTNAPAFADAAAVRDNLGLGATNDVSFNSVAVTNAALTRTNLGLGATAQTIFAVKTNDQTIIDETNATTITDLTFATEPGARYVVTFLPIIEASAINNALQVVASNATAYGNWNGLGAGSSGIVEATNEATFAATTARSPLQTFYVEGSTNAGSISVTFRSTVATNTNTIKAGSFLRADKMP